MKGGPATPEVKVFPKHKKNAEVGDKKTVFASSLLIEQEDALSFEDNEEVSPISLCYRTASLNGWPQITLMDWGNAIVRKKEVDASGKITSIEVDLHLEGDFRKTKKKITWLAAPSSDHPLIDATLLDHDYLITKKKLDENDEFKDVVTPQTEFREEVLADANVTDLKKGDIMQFERKGYYIFDGKAEDGKLEFIHIPDGRAASIASKAGVAADTSTKEKKGESAKTTSDTPVDTKMYKMETIYGDKKVETTVETNMYKIDTIYDS